MNFFMEGRGQFYERVEGETPVVGIFESGNHLLRRVQLLRQIFLAQAFFLAKFWETGRRPEGEVKSIHLSTFPVGQINQAARRRGLISVLRRLPSRSDSQSRSYCAWRFIQNPAEVPK